MGTLITLQLTHLESDERSSAVPLARVLAVPRGADHVVGDVTGAVQGPGGARSIGPDNRQSG